MIEQMLARARENSTNAVGVLSPELNQTLLVASLLLCNTSGAACTYRLFHDGTDGGTTYNETTALVWDAPLAANTTAVLELKIVMAGLGTLAYRSSVANAITLTAYGFQV